MLGIVLGIEGTLVNQIRSLPSWHLHSSRGRQVKFIASQLAISVKEKNKIGKGERDPIL